MSEFTPAVVVYDAGALEQQINEDLEANIEGWTPARAGLARWVNRAYARVSALLGNQTAASSAKMFGRFGETIARVPPILAAPSTAVSTWTAIDNLGYTVEDGTEVNIAVNGGEVRAFVVVGDVVIPPGSTSTATGAVFLQAREPGTGGDGLLAEPRPVSAKTAWVQQIALETVTAGGVDEEGEDEYLNRLVDEMKLFSRSLILPRDFEIDALSNAGVARALAIPAYNPVTKESNVPNCVTVIPIDANGQGKAAAAREALQVSQAANLLSGTLNFVDVPTYTKLDVEAVGTVRPGYEPAAVKAAAAAVIAEYLSPARWGSVSSGEATAGWVVVDHVYRNELIELLGRVAGWDRTVTLKLAKSGSALATVESIALPGVAPLTEVGEVKVSTE